MAELDEEQVLFIHQHTWIDHGNGKRHSYSIVDTK